MEAEGNELSFLFDTVRLLPLTYIQFIISGGKRERRKGRQSVRERDREREMIKFEREVINIVELQRNKQKTRPDVTVL